MSDNKKRACDRCHRMKQVCTGVTPCNRCIAKNVQCQTIRPLKKTGRPLKHTQDKHQEIKNPISPIEISQLEKLSTPIKVLQFLIENNTVDLTSTCNSLISQINLNNQLDETEKQYLCYFINKVVQVLFSSEILFIFLNTVMPLALNNQIIRDPIIAIAATHCACDHNNSILGNFYIGTEVPTNTSFRDFHYFRSRAKANRFDLDKNASKDTLLLSILLIITMEVLIGMDLDWFILLDKANNIINEIGGLKYLIQMSKFNDLHSIIIQLFTYLDLISSVSTCNKPYSEQQMLNASNEISLTKQLTFKFGIAGDLFKIMGNISTLASLRNQKDSNFNQMAHEIELKLQNWTIPDTISFENVDDVTRTQYALALQWASFLRLHQVKHGYNRSESRPQRCLQNILNAILRIPEGSNVEAGLLYPVVLAGSVVIDKDDREYLLKRLKSIQKSLKFPYVKQFEKLLINIWRKDDKEGDLVNWAAVRYYEYPGLVMF